MRSVVLAHAFVAGGRAERVGARHQRRWRLDGADVAVRRHLLHRARPPPRSATLGETLRYSGSPLAYSFSEAAPHQGLLAGRPRREGVDVGGVRRGAGAATAWRASRATSSRSSPTPARRRRGPLGPGDPHRRGPAGPPDGAAAQPLPRHPGAGLRAGRSAGAVAGRCDDPRPQRPRGRPRLRRRDARRAGHRRRVRACCCRPATPAPTTPTPTCCSRWPTDAPPPAVGHGVRPFRRDRRGRLRRAVRRRPLPALRSHRRRQVQRPRRRLLRPVRRDPRRPQPRRPAALRPGAGGPRAPRSRSTPRCRAGASGSSGRPPGSGRRSAAPVRRASPPRSRSASGPTTSGAR